MFALHFQKFTRLCGVRMSWVNCCNSNLSQSQHFFSSEQQKKQKEQQKRKRAVEILNAMSISTSSYVIFANFRLQTNSRCQWRWHLLSVGVPFRGDHIGLRRNPLWKEVLSKNSLQRMDRFVVFADIVNKINRSNGKARGFLCENKCLPTNKRSTTNYRPSGVDLTSTWELKPV